MLFLFCHSSNVVFVREEISESHLPNSVLCLLVHLSMIIKLRNINTYIVPCLVYFVFRLGV